jgi:hypothetical protein
MRLVLALALIFERLDTRAKAIHVRFSKKLLIGPKLRICA